MENTAFPGFAKIGWSRNPDRRLQTYQRSDPLRRFALRTVYYFQHAPNAESAIHYHLRRRRQVGEWFAMCPSEAAEYVKRFHQCENY